MKRSTKRRIGSPAAPLAFLFLTLVPANPAGARPAAGGAILDVPYLSQTEALCGGAAAAMIFRYYGDRHADVQQFEPLVDRRAGGIADDVLVRAIQDRQWLARRIDGTIDSLRTHLAAGEPLMLLLEDRPQRYHFVVAVGASDDAVYVHDPAWGPARRFSIAQLMRSWGPSGNWTLLVRPTASRPAASESAHSEPPRSKSHCDELLDLALDRIAARGIASADDALASVRAQCPDNSAPVSELAGVRFAERRTREAASLAAEALRINPSDRYAWDVLGSSRFVLNDSHGSLRAWNHVDKPKLDSVRIDGLTHTRYSLVAQALNLKPNTVLTDRDFTFAERRLQQLPDRLTARIGYRPEIDGFATVEVVVVERPFRPRGLIEWGAAAAQTFIDREIVATIPGRTGQGELWTASWRWWSNRPRAAIAFAAPRVGAFPGVWRVDASWSEQTYAASDSASAGLLTREDHAHGGVSATDWLSPGLRYEIATGLDVWNKSRRAIAVGGTLEHRAFGDRIATAASATTWFPVTSGGSFRSFTTHVTIQSSREPTGIVALGRVGIDAASAVAPLALWSGAGEGRARAPLLRAHPLLDDGVITGSVFGRVVQYANVEAQNWFARPSLARAGIAAFADVARAEHRLAGSGAALHADAGIGVRLRVPGREGTLRVDYAHGLRDGADALTIGWQTW